MNRDDEVSVVKSPVRRQNGSLTVIRGPCSRGRCVLRVEGSLRAPLDGELRHDVRDLLRRGERIIMLDLSRVSKIDAAGVSELVRAYNMATEAHGVLQIVHATARVRRVLERVRLFEVLSAG
jgi:anti-anti-sigma factor